MALQLLMQTMAVCSCLQPGGCCYSRHGCLVCCTNVGSGAPPAPSLSPRSETALLCRDRAVDGSDACPRFGSAQRA